MREFQERRRQRKLLHSRYAIAALAVLCLILAHAVWSVYGKYEKSKEVALKAEREYASLVAKQESLTASIADLNTDLGREREIRERFGAVKEGEKMIVLVEDSSTKKDANALPPKTLWQRFLGLFKRD